MFQSTVKENAVDLDVIYQFKEVFPAVLSLYI